jgi:hypothetical protein
MPEQFQYWLCHLFDGSNLTLSSVTNSFAYSFKTVQLMYFWKSLCLNHTTSDLLITSYFPVFTPLHFAKMFPFPHRISDFFGIMEFNAEGATHNPSAMATQNNSRFESTYEWY